MAISKSVRVLLRFVVPPPTMPLLVLLYTCGVEVSVGCMGRVVEVKTIEETGFQSPMVLISWYAWRYCRFVPSLVVRVLDALTFGVRMR